jgi:hypothetical protein
MGEYIILYCVEGPDVSILGVVRGRRDLENLFEQRAAELQEWLAKLAVSQVSEARLGAAGNWHSGIPRSPEKTTHLPVREAELAPPKRSQRDS